MPKRAVVFTAKVRPGPGFLGVWRPRKAAAIIELLTLGSAANNYPPLIITGKLFFNCRKTCWEFAKRLLVKVAVVVVR